MSATTFGSRYAATSCGRPDRPNPAHVRRDDPETVAHQERHLVAPQPRGIGKSVHEQHRDTGTVLLDVQGHAVDLDEPPRIRVHASLRCTSARADGGHDGDLELRLMSQVFPPVDVL
jgi:hypothetical protein